MSPTNSTTPTETPEQLRGGRFRRHCLRYGLVGVAGLITLVAVFYTAENARGKRAWEAARRELVAKGQVLDWNAYIPPTIPDDQNVFGTPQMARWFVGRGDNELTRLLSHETLAQFARQQNAIAELTVVPSKADLPADADLVLRYDPPVLTLASAQAKSPVAEPVIPLVTFDDVRLTEAIQNIARMGDVNYTLDSKVAWPAKGPDQKVIREPIVSIRWTNVTAHQALTALLDNYNLILVEGPNTNAAVIMKRESNKVYLEPSARERIVQLLQTASEQNSNRLSGLSLKGCRNFTFFAGPPDPIKPARLFLRADSVPPAREVAQFFPGSTTEAGAAGFRWQIEPAGSNSFHVLLGSQPAYTAADYIAWTDQFEADFNTIREALKRPAARMPGNYQRPFTMPIPNFVAIRNLAQTLAQRTQCHLLLGQPDEALRDLTLLHDLYRLTEARPTGKPMSLVAAMINVAVRGLYVTTVADGFRLQAWREPQLAALQDQLKDVNLLRPVYEAFKTEPAAMCQMIENTPAADIRKIFSPDEKTTWQKMTDPLTLLLALGPRGWRYQNIATIARLQQPIMDSIDVEHGLIDPKKVAESSTNVAEVVAHPSPYTLMASLSIPNYKRATMVLAHNQTVSREALIACALERYRLAHNEYPDSLAALTPQYLERVPVDAIGQPFKYAKEGGKFTLYSIGWNETDDHATRGPDAQTYDVGDWVWPPQAK